MTSSHRLMTLAIFPIETDMKGGTMHTVKFAQEQNRLIFCPDINLLKDKYQPNFAKISKALAILRLPALLMRPCLS